MVRPVFQVACFEHTLDKLEKAWVVYPLLQELNQPFVVHGVEETAYVKLTEPLYTSPDLLYLLEGRMARPFRSESMRILREYRLIDTFQKDSGGFLHQLVITRRNTERTLTIASRFGNVSPSHRGESVLAPFQFSHDTPDAFLGESIQRIGVDALGDGSLVGIEVSIRLQPQLLAVG